MKLIYLVPLLLLLCRPASSQPLALVDGTVTNAATGAPLEGARVKLDSQGNSLVTSTDARGHFQFANLQPGQYTIAADLPGFLQPGESGTRTSVVATSLNLRRPIDGGPPVGPDGVPHATVNIPMTPAGAIFGKITEPGGAPCASCRVQLMRKVPLGTPPWSLLQSVNADDRGEYRISRMLAGEYYLGVDQLRGGVHVATFRPAYYPASLTPDGAKGISLATGQEFRADFGLLNLPGVRVAGEIVPPDSSKPLGAVTDLLLTLDASIIYLPVTSSATASPARFEFHDVVPGKYTLTALTRDNAAGSVLAAIQHVEITDGGLDGLQVALHPAADVPGTVIFGPGCVAVPVTIGIMELTPFTAPIGRFGNAATSAPDGTFILHGLRPGRIRVNPGFPRNFTGYPVDVTVSLNGHELPNDTLEYPLPPGASLRVGIKCNVDRRAR